MIRNESAHQMRQGPAVAAHQADPRLQPAAAQSAAPAASVGRSWAPWIIAGVFAALTLLILVVAAVVVALGTISRPAEPGGEQADRLAPQRLEIEQLESELSGLRKQVLELETQLRETQREAQSAHEQLRNLLETGKTTSWTPHPASNGNLYAWSDSLLALTAIRSASLPSLLGQLKYNPENHRPQTASHQQRGALPIQTVAYEGEARRLDTRLSELRAERLELEQQISSHRSDIADLEAARESLRAQVEQLRGFAGSDLVFIQQDSLAVGVRVESADRATITAKAEGLVARYAGHMAGRAGIVRIKDNGRLTRRLNLGGRVGELISAALAADVRQYWQPRLYVPLDADAMVTYHDLDADAYPIGFYQGHNADEIQLATVSTKDEVVPRTRVGPGTALRGSGKRLLARAPSIDYIDFVVLQIGKELNSPDKPTHHRVAVQTKVDLSSGRLDRLAGYRPTRYMHPWLRFLLESDALNADRSSGHFEADRKLEAIRNELEDRVVDRLTKLGVTTLERENLAGVLQEQRIRGTLGPIASGRQVTETQKWTNESRTRTRREESVRGPSVAAVDNKLDVARTLNQPIPIEESGSIEFATHVLEVELGDAPDPGSLRFAIRLLDSQSGEVLWSDTARRPFYNPALASDHMLGSGTLWTINARKSGGRVAGYGLAHPFDADGRSPLLSRVSYLEQDAGSQLYLRDLFSYRTYPISAERRSTDTSWEVDGLNTIPQDNRMRHLMWSVIQAVRPPAGRVTRVGDLRPGESFAEVACNNARQRFKSARLCTASRLERDFGDTSEGVYFRRLPLDLTVREVTNRGLRVVFDTTGRDALWSDEAALQPGDIVCPRGERQPLVAVAPLRMLRPTAQDAEKLGLSSPIRRDRFDGWASDGAVDLAQKLAGALDRFQTATVEVNNPASATAAGATHIVDGRLRPAAGEAFWVEVVVRKVGQPNPLKTLRTKLGREQLKKWKP